MTRKAFRAKSYGLRAAQLQLPQERGSIGFISSSLYLLHLHSNRYAQWMQNPESLPVAQTKAFGEHKLPRLDKKVARGMVDLVTHPVQEV